MDKRRGPRVLPDDGVVVRAAGAPIPHDRRLALIGDTKRDEVAGVEPVLAQNGLRDRDGALPDLDRVVLDPPGPRQDLLMLELVLSDLVPVVVEHHEPAAGRALVYGGDEVPHLASLTAARPAHTEANQGRSQSAVILDLASLGGNKFLGHRG